MVCFTDTPPSLGHPTERAGGQGTPVVNHRGLLSACLRPTTNVPHFSLLKCKLHLLWAQR